MARNDIQDASAFLSRQKQIIEGMQEGVRREVKSLKERGLPVFVFKDGRVVDINSPEYKKSESSS